MKNLLVIVSMFAFLTTSNAESIPRDYWFVVSDSVSPEIPNNVCVVTGRAYEAWSESGVESAVISNLDRSSNTITDSLGNYRLVLSSNDTAIFFYHPKYTEIVCWKYNFKGGHHVTMNFVTSEKLPEGMMIMEEKPVIYVYSESDLSVTLKLSNENDFTFTYPKYNNGWQIDLRDNRLYVEDNMYPYLFWEGEKKELNFNTRENKIIGEQIKTDTCISYLKTKLSNLGLNKTETTDFITYWGPRLIEKPFAVVQFLVDEEYDSKIGELIVKPKPNAQRRIYILYKSMDKYDPHIQLQQSQESKEFIRSGLTIVEWGGSEFNSF